jgi:hypothetical protein
MCWQLHLLQELSRNDALFPMQFDRRQVITLHQAHAMQEASSLFCSPPHTNTSYPLHSPFRGQSTFDSHSITHTAAHTFIPLLPSASAPHTPISMIQKMREVARTPSTLRPQGPPQPQTPNLLQSGAGFPDADAHKAFTWSSGERGRAGRLAGVGMRLSEDAPHTGKPT